MADSAPTISAADTVTPWYLDKAFLLVALHMVAGVVLAAFGIKLNEAAVSADLIGLVSFVVAHKAKSGAALLALIKAQAQARYLEGPAKPLPATAADLDAPPKV